MAWDSTKTQDDPWLSQDYNDLVSAIKSTGTLNEPEQYRGSDCSGSDGATGRVLTLSNTTTTLSKGFQVFKNGLLMHSPDITVSHKSSGSTITFNVEVWDTDYIEVHYFTQPS